MNCQRWFLLQVSDALQLDKGQFDTIAAEMDYLDDDDIDALVVEFESIPGATKEALFG